MFLIYENLIYYKFTLIIQIHKTRLVCICFLYVARVTTDNKDEMNVVGTMINHSPGIRPMSASTLLMMAFNCLGMVGMC